MLQVKQNRGSIRHITTWHLAVFKKIFVQNQLREKNEKRSNTTIGRAFTILALRKEQ